MNRPAPPPAVLDAWGAGGCEPVALDGGRAFRCGAVVVKPVLERREAEWIARTLASLPVTDDIRIIRPVPSAAGEWVVDGWIAWEHLPGAHRPGRWRDVLEVADRFHEVTRSVAAPAGLVRDHAWAQGDAFAWGERDLAVPEPLDAVVSALRDRCRPLELDSQLVHGDLTNNVLFHDELAPAVIDVSPFWRPARYAKAIVIADSIGWFGAGAEAVAPLADDEGVQLLLRAVLFRLGSAVVLCADEPERLEAEVTAYGRLLACIAGQGG